MVEVCQQIPHTSMSSLSDGVMKHPNNNVELFEFNIGQALHMRCVNTKKACGQCESCQLNTKLKEAKEWLGKFGDHSKKRFMLGLMRRFQSVDLLQQMVTLLQPLLYKDFTYARSRTTPSLKTDTASLSSDRAVPSKDVEAFILTTWNWFQKANYWSKANYAMSLLQLCDSHLLHILGTQARTLLVSEERAASFAAEDDLLEAASIASTNYTYQSDERPDLDLLIRATPEYGIPKLNPLTGEELFLDDEIENDDSGDESFTSMDILSVDPACMVVPTSAKASSGVAKYKDFIRFLPVHIAKYVLGFLDIATLHNALCVSNYWSSLVEEVHKEFRINQDLCEEVMLMQGASAQGANPVYAKDVDVLVPNRHLGTREIITTKDQVVKAKYKNEVNFETALSGISCRKVIMEERNVYCGSYNVMVLKDVEDSHRVVHTCGGKLIAIGSKDRKVRFIERESGKEQGPVITGHAGSVRCVYLCEDDGYVLSGSYDTSIRMWNMETGKCMRIFRGHRDTILTVMVYGDYLVSGAKDNCCKVWNMQTGKCQRTFKHRKPVWAVAMNEELCITGCEGGRVKVWDVKTGDLVKMLSGHHDQVTSIKFDKWHIITGSKDGYALVWSAQGYLSRCLNALRHPKAVLCVEFMYLRVITGSADGRLRIWNMVNGQCCRIMRGNSRSDAIQSIIAIGNRITLNTSVNLLVLNFEKVEWDYTLENDKVPPLVQYSSYADTPIRSHPYSYIRAQRMVRAGATNSKIVLHNRPGEIQERHLDSGRILPQTSFHAPQYPHSAKTLSSRSMASARQIQSQGFADVGFESMHFTAGTESRLALSEVKTAVSSRGKSRASTAPSKPPLPKTRPLTHKSGVSQHSVIIAEPNPDQYDDDDDDENGPSASGLKRRVSWAFEKPLLPKSKDISLSETKSLLRSQIRMKSESIVPPDFIYMTVNAIQNSMKTTETNSNTQVNFKLTNNLADTLKNRPSSSPPKIDPRTRLGPGEIGIEKFIIEDKVDTMSEFSDVKSIKSIKSTKAKDDGMPESPEKEIYATPCDIKPTKIKLRQSLHSKKTKSTVPIGRVIRPISASAKRKETDPELKARGIRPGTAPAQTNRPDTAVSVRSTIAPSLPGVSPPQKPRGQYGLSSTAMESSVVPMLMYPADMKEKLSQLIQEKRSQNKIEDVQSAGDGTGQILGKVSAYNDPMRSHVKFDLRTYEQEKDYISSIEKMFSEQKLREEEELEKKQRSAWLARAKSRPRSQQPPSKVRPGSNINSPKSRPSSLCPNQVKIRPHSQPPC
ncbi:F-box and WD repeat domain containing protein 10B-like [Ylistrum balloti]|uniref:F-box and WD repeat domain containing protein 10B-like n=1 Tax=Ylistrum balloti TaxID=509963 RepID=UPI002905DCC4|nr:F-box and WD repeat domain containing protein 10B-like [Ylistrum balloti]